MILAQSFGPTSSLSLPGIVTLPGFTGCRNCRWLPRVVIWYQPSRSTIRIASRTFGMAQAVRSVLARSFLAMPKVRTMSDSRPVIPCSSTFSLANAAGVGFVRDAPDSPAGGSVALRASAEATRRI